MSSGSSKSATKFKSRGREAGSNDPAPDGGVLFESDATGLLELKRIAESLAADIETRPAEPRAWEHPARCAGFWSRRRAIGRLSELHPSADRYRPRLRSGSRSRAGSGTKTGADELQAGPPIPNKRLRPFGDRPARELAGTLESKIRELAGELAETVEYVREYQGVPLQEGKKSVTFRITAGAPDRTLSSPEITALYDAIVAGLTSLGYEFRA